MIIVTFTHVTIPVFTEGVGKTCPESAAKVLFPEYEIDLEPEELEAGREKSEAEVMKEYEELLRSGQVTHQDDDGEYGDVMLTWLYLFHHTHLLFIKSYMFVFYQN